MTSDVSNKEREMLQKKETDGLSNYFNKISQIIFTYHFV